MEKAIFKTLAYADIFDYPLKINEIHKWLIGRKASLRQIKKVLESLSKKKKVKSKKDYYFLFRRDDLVNKRKKREKQSVVYLRKAKLFAAILKVIPWIKLVGISGGLAMDNAKESDDIDLFIITSKNRLWISRILALGLLSLSGQRRKVTDNGRRIAGKLCVNILLEEDRLEQSSKDIYLAHEVLQMRPLWQRDGIYQKYLEDNQWAFKFLPNWIGSSERENKNSNTTYYILHTTIGDIFENLARKFQLWYMKLPKGMERIENGAVYFHPNDIRLKVLAALDKRCQFLV